MLREGYYLEVQDPSPGEVPVQLQSVSSPQRMARTIKYFVEGEAIFPALE